MQIGTRYCGGCNPYYDRGGLVRELEGILSEKGHRILQGTGEQDNLQLLLQGCAKRCRDADPAVHTIEIDPGTPVSEILKRIEEWAMSWKKTYESKCIPLEKAIRLIPSDSRIVVGHAVGEPVTLTGAMVANKEKYKNVELVHLVPMHSCEYVNPGMEAHFRHNAIFLGASTRKGFDEGRVDFTPCFFHEVPRLFQKGYLPVDVALIQVTPPDKDGYCSLGLSVDYTKPAAQCARIVIAEVNDQYPRTAGDRGLHIDEIDWFVQSSHPIREMAPPQIGPVEKAIGAHCASLVEDGATLQLGIGAIPDAVLASLGDKKDLGIHTEMFADGVVDLYERGVITNSKKTLHPGKMVATFLMGTQRLYDFVNNNPDVELYPVDYVNDVRTIAKNDKMTAINSCVEVDLMGQVCAESIGLKQISGVGGQVDYVRGASMSEGGRAIIAMPSTAAGGKTSRIVPCLSEGAAVTTSRNDVQYIVTEYGVAELRGKSLRDRGRALIEIAHPDFRAQLIDVWEKRFKTTY